MYGVFIEYSTIRRNKAGLVLFAGRPLPKAKFVLYYFGSLVYRSLSMDLCNTVVYVDGLMVVTSENFLDTSVDLLMNVREHYGSIHYVLIVPTSFFVESYVNDPLYYDYYEE